MTVSRTQHTNRSNPDRTRVHNLADRNIERLLQEIDVTTALQLEPSTYFGVYCKRCKCDAIPMPDGRCGWCDTKIAA